MIPKISSLAFLFFPTLLFAQSSQTLEQILRPITDFLSGKLLEVVMGLALAAFFFGVALYIYQLGDKQNLEYARGILLWGVIGLAVMFSVGGIALLLQKTIGISENDSLPRIDERDYQINTGYSR